MFVEINRFRNRQVGFEIPLINILKSQLYTQICQVKWLLSWLFRMRCQRSKFSKDSTLISKNTRKRASMLEISSRHSCNKRHALKKKSAQECSHVSECADIFFKECSVGFDMPLMNILKRQHATQFTISIGSSTNFWGFLRAQCRRARFVQWLHTVMHCNALHCTATHYPIATSAVPSRAIASKTSYLRKHSTIQPSAAHCNTPHHPAPTCISPHHPAPHTTHYNLYNF